jgi:hypothetical protein
VTPATEPQPATEPTPAADAPAAAAPAPAVSPTSEPTPVAEPAAPPPPPPPAEPAHGEQPRLVTEGQFGKGVTLKSEDDRFSLNIRARIQARATLTHNSDDDDPPATEMQIRRMRVVLQGNALGRDLTYYIQLSFSNLDMEPDLRTPLRDSYFTWRAGRDASLRAGQMKVPFDRQRVISSSALQMVDRSIVVQELNLDRDVGAQLFSKDLFGLGERLGYHIGVFGGDGRNRLSEVYGLLYAARLELRPFGGFDDYVEADTGRGAKPRLSIGVAAGYNQNTNRPRSTLGEPFPGSRFDYEHACADMLFKWHGFSAMAQWIYRRGTEDRRVDDVNGTPTPAFSRSAWGAFGQVGQMVTEHVEVSARFGHIEPYGGTDPRFVRRQELGGGLSYYWFEHNLKLQGDYFYEPLGGRLIGDTDVGTRVRHQFRLQAQIFF